MKNKRLLQIKSSLLLPLLAVLAMVLVAGTSNAAVGGMTIGGCVYTGDGTPTYSRVGAEVVATWDTKYGAATTPVTGAVVMIQNQHHGGTFNQYVYANLGANSNCWEAVMADGNGDGVPDVSDIIAMISAPGHAVTSREFTWDPDGRFGYPNATGAPAPNMAGGPLWPGTTATTGEFIHPTGLHPDAGGTGTESVWAVGAQDAYLMSYPQKTTSALHYVFYDNLVDGNDNGPIIDPGINGVTVRVFDEDGNVVATQVTGDLAFNQGGFITDDGVVYAGPNAYGYVYFQGLPGNGEYRIEADPSTMTQAVNPHFQLQLPENAGACTTGGHVDYDQGSCGWWQTYTEEVGHAPEVYAWPGSPGTMGGGYLTWSAFVEKLPSDVNPDGSKGNPFLNGTISGTLLDSTGNFAGEPVAIDIGGRVPPTNARFESDIAWNITRSGAGWGIVPDPNAPARDVIPNSKVWEGRVVLFRLDLATPVAYATAVATQPDDYNDPVNGGFFEFTNVPPGTYGLFAMDKNLFYVMFTGANVQLNPGGNVVAGPFLYERWGARSMGFVTRTDAAGTVGGAGPNLVVKNWYKAGTIKNNSTTKTSGWFLTDFWPETGQMGTQFVDMPDGVDYRGKIVTEQYQDVPTIIEAGPVMYSWATHNSMSRAVGYATHNYFVDLQVEDIPAGVGNLIGAVYNDHFSDSRGQKGDSAYGGAEDRLWQGWGTELYSVTPAVAPLVAVDPLNPTAAELAAQAAAQAVNNAAACSALATVKTCRNAGSPRLGKYCTAASECDTVPLAGDGSCVAGVTPAPDRTAKSGKFSKADAGLMGWNQPYTYPVDETGSMFASPVMLSARSATVNDPAIKPADWVQTEGPNIGTSDSETTAYLADPNYAPMPGFYEYRDVAPGDYCVRVVDKAGFRRSPDDVDSMSGADFVAGVPGGFTYVAVTDGLNSRIDLGVNTTPTSVAVMPCLTCVPAVAGNAFCTGYTAAVAADPLAVPPVLAAAEVLGSCDSNTDYSCVEDPLNPGFSTDCQAIASTFGIKMGGEIEGGVWDGMQAPDACPTSLLFTDSKPLIGSPIAVKDGNDYLLGVGYQGDPRCDAYNNSLHVPGDAFPITNPNYDPCSCRSTLVVNGKPEFERRFAPGANRYIGNAKGFLWNRQDPSLPALFGGQDPLNPAYDSMELGIGVPQAAYKFEAAWTPLTAAGGGGGITAPFCAIGISTNSQIVEGTLWSANATVNVSDGWTAINGAKVQGTWSTGATQTCVTGPTGQCNLFLETVNGASSTLTIDTITPDTIQPWYVYNTTPGGVLNGACRTSVVAYDPAGPPPPPVVYQCEDGIDNDGDGLTDFPSDPGCLSATDNDETDAPAPVYQCSDGIDNDGDGLTDFPADPGCLSATDNDETDPPPAPVYQCSDGIDNDGDGLIDMLDPGCTGITDNDETDPPVGGPVSVHVIGMTGTAGNVEGKLTGTVDVTVEDDTLGPVSGATVNFTFTWLKEGQPTTKQMNCTTDGTGQCSATTKPMENAAFVDISLVNVNHPTLTYVMGDNTIGTSTVTVP